MLNRGGAGRCLILLAAAAIASRVQAEGNAGPPRRAGTPDRVYGANFLKPVAGGLVTVGGSRLRWLAPGARSWTTLITVPGNLYRVGFDDVGARVLAFWEKEESVHLLGLRDHSHSTLALPPLGDARAHFISVHSLSFDSIGSGALVYVSGPAFSNRGQITRAYRLPISGQQPPELLWEQDDNSDLVWTCGRGALYILPSDPDRKGHWKSSLTGGLYAFDLDGGSLKRIKVWYDPKNRFRSVQVASGSTPNRIVATVMTGRGSQGYLTWRWGGPEAVYREFPPGPGPSGGSIVSPQGDELLYFVDRGTTLEIIRWAIDSGVIAQSTPIWATRSQVRVRGGQRTLGSRVMGKGFRADGSVWVQLGDDMALIGLDGRVRRVDLARMVGGKPEWAGSSLSLNDPECLWVGIEIGRGRDWVRLDFSKMEKRAKPWPAKLPDLPPVSNDYDRERMTKCLPPDALIATPAGEVPVSELQVGTPVWTMNANGDRVVGTVVRTGRASAPAGHRMIRIVLADGRMLTVSPGHPLPDGRTAGSWLKAKTFDGSEIRSARTLAYTGTGTFDLLPSGGTGVYWANGIPLASTLSASPDP